MIKKLGRRQDRNVLIAAQFQQMAVTRNDGFGVAGNRHRNELVVVWISIHNGDKFVQPYNCGRRVQQRKKACGFVVRNALL